MRTTIARIVQAWRAVSDRHPFLLVSLITCCAVLMIAVTCYGDYSAGTFGWDFERAYRQAGIAVLHGHSPYPAPNTSAVSRGDTFVYPPPSAFSFVPYAFLPQAIAVTVFSAASIIAAAVIPRLLDVRDWRVVAALLLWPSVSLSLALGTQSILLALPVALAWRWRDRALPAGVAVAAAAIAKVYLAPLIVWLAFTRRFRAALVALVALVGVTIGSWWIIGFAGMRDYPALLSALSRAEIRDSYSPAGIVNRLGISATASSALGVLIALGLLAISIRLYRRGAEIAAFCGVLGAALGGSPLVWHHYAVLLVVPIALVAPRLEPLWFAPLLLGVSFDSRAGAGDLRAIAFTVIVGGILVVCGRRDPVFVARRASSGSGRVTRIERDTVAARPRAHAA